MSLRPFTAQFPRQPQDGDEVMIRGMLKEDAQRFSVNFCLKRPSDVPPHATPPYIAYHFKTMYDDEGDSQVVQNFKSGQWGQDEEVLENFWHTDRCEPFTLIFRLHEEKIKVFVGDIQHPPDYEFELQLPMTEIESIELWDDVEEVKEISFSYHNGQCKYNGLDERRSDFSRCDEIGVLFSVSEISIDSATDPGFTN